GAAAAAERMYTTLKFLHLLGVVLLVGNVIVTALWKTLADRSGNPATVAFAQRTVALADWVFTLPGVLLVLIGGYGMAARRPWPPPGLPRLGWGPGVLWLTGLIWVIVLGPTRRLLVAGSGVGGLTGHFPSGVE